MPLPLIVQQALLWAGVQVVSWWLDSHKGKTAKYDRTQSTGSGIPSNEQGAPVPVVWGHCLISSPQIMIATGYQEGFDDEISYNETRPTLSGIVAFALCRGELIEANEDGLLMMRFGGHRPVDENSPQAPSEPLIGWCQKGESYAYAPIEYPTPVYGGEWINISDTIILPGVSGMRVEGRFHDGNEIQNADAQLLAAIGGGATLPGFRRIAYLWLENYLGVGPILPPYEFEVRRCPEGGLAGGGTHLIADPDGFAGVYDANPAEIIYDILLNNQYGMALSAVDVDTAGFTTVAQALYDEGLGMSLMWDGLSPIRSIIDEVLLTIGGVLFTGSTGKIGIRLLRAADVSQLSLSTDNVASLEMEETAWEFPTDAVQVEYNLRPLTLYKASGIQKASVMANDPARFAWGSTGSITKMRYEGVRRADIAEKLAVRDLRILTTPVRRFRAVVDRTAYALEPGHVVLLTWADYGLTALRCRVDSVDLGDLEGGEIMLNLVEDVFDATAAAFLSPESDDVPADPVRVGYGYAYGYGYGGVG